MVTRADMRLSATAARLDPRGYTTGELRWRCGHQVLRFQLLAGAAVAAEDVRMRLSEPHPDDVDHWGSEGVRRGAGVVEGSIALPTRPTTPLAAPRVEQSACAAQITTT